MKKITNFLVLILAISLCFTIIGCEPLAEPPTEPPSGSPSGAPSGSLPELVEIGDLFEYFCTLDGEVHVRTEENFYLNQTIMSEVIGGQNAESIVIEGVSLLVSISLDKLELIVTILPNNSVLTLPSSLCLFVI